MLTCLEIPPIEAIEERQKTIVELVGVADALGFGLQGFMDENDLLRKMEVLEVELLSDLIYKKDQEMMLEEIFESALRLEKFETIIEKIRSALELPMEAYALV
jgi:hypothetical protein